MKQLGTLLALAFLLLGSVHVYAQPGATKPSGAKTPPPPAGGGPPGPMKKMITLSGEILDMGCWTSRGLRGALHRECALKCLASGIPMGIITADSVVYVLTQNHDRAMTPQQFRPPDPFGQCKSWAALQAEVTGYFWERRGTRMLEVRSAKLLPAPTPAAAPTP